jgi:hypothetical protein
MRKVIIKMWIDAVPGQRGHWSLDFIQMGYFHGWGTAKEEFPNKVVVNITVAIIELPNGEMITTYPNNVKFLEAPGKELVDFRARQ